MARNGIDWKGLVVNTLYMRDGGICQLCNRFIGSDNLFEIDHIQEKENGGLDILDNLRLVHIACHKARHQKNGTHIPKEIVNRCMLVKMPDYENIKQAKDIKRESQLALLRLVKKRFIELGSYQAAVSACATTIDSMRYQAGKYGFKGNPSKWDI